MTSNNNNKNRPKSVLKVGTCLLGCCTGWRGPPTFRRNQPISWPWTKNRAISIHNCSSLGHDFKSPAIVITIVQGLTALLVVNKQTNSSASLTSAAEERTRWAARQLHLPSHKQKMGEIWSIDAALTTGDPLCGATFTFSTPPHGSNTTSR